ncbi:4-alpha-glucanotransferase [Dickeya solani]|uniref:4-alpha-glucanotransferase n=1 Tax=Dickeya solani D s0432-1 TaxID=1231725 RepID=A0AAV3K8R2_9GAMM|nr:4-alpha-glucanotransferase [Dickeya solani]ANE75146.1 4-alpha-glucanotransferase [Dickeya solani IPO 2222]AUC42515.1 4-alpha-glucanotransferase (amylomaltase) [Dickeya solani RNS 08.23.3.1.A]AUH09440.1 4-alpha-glucanotransferase [Dickeya solani D s0432-1]AUH13413.1 4-alpha-glucanotransferase [Dickeya solani]AYQ49682.1 4-alpha-glucanotransferase [Dickeya solani]
MALKAKKSVPQHPGIADTYKDAYGNEQAIDQETRDKLLQLLDVAEPTVAPLPSVYVFRQGQQNRLPLRDEGEYGWTLTYEKGGIIEGRSAGQAALALPDNLPLGYHQLILMQGEQQWPCRVIVAPARCYEPDPLTQGKRWWGVMVQLYTLRSSDNWGSGDFGDLKTLVEQVARRGGAFVGLNPLHALYPAEPEAASPYSPSSRNWLNIIYIDVNQVDDFHQSDAAGEWWKQDDVQRRLTAARASRWVDYATVTSLKLTALRLAFNHFNRRNALDPRKTAFQQFLKTHDESLLQQATYDALQAWLKTQGQTAADWLQWPREYHDARSDASLRFRQEHVDDVQFYCWLQWLAHEQLASCFSHSKQLGMPIGLYRDLAVGVAQGGVDTWGDQQLHCMSVTLGAPPDPLGPGGQNWNLTPMHPVLLRQRDYQPFIDLLRSNMAHSGALRIDHVMGLLRLWWILNGNTATRGAYVLYPVDDLLGILALESHRHRCLVIGEDLGTVPEEIVNKLRDNSVYSYKVLFFEKDQHDRFRAPDAYPPRSMATITTHDLATLRGYWQGVDLTLGKDLGLYPTDALLQQQHDARESAKQGLLDALHEQGLLPQRVGRNASLTTMSAQLNRGVQRYLADSASALLGLQLEDWLDMATPVNVPGTHQEYPNWRRKLSRSLDSIFTDRYLERLIRDIDLRRGGPVPSRTKKTAKPAGDEKQEETKKGTKKA